MKDVLGIIFAFDGANEPRELTDHRCAASIAYGGRYRVVDFMLSSMVNSDIFEIGIILKDRYQSLMDHIGSGKDWDLARKRGGVFLLPPYSYAKTDIIGFGGPYQGKIDGLAGAYLFLQRSRHKYVALADGNIVANVDFGDLLERHIASGADITAVTVGSGTVGATLNVGSEHKITNVLLNSYFEKGKTKKRAAGIYIIEKSLLEDIILECAAKNLFDWDRDVLQRLCGELDMREYEFDGYLSKISSMSVYYRSSMDLFKKEVRDSLFSQRRPLHTRIRDDEPTSYGSGASVKNCLVAGGCIINGTVENSILFRGVKIEAGAVVKNSIIMRDGYISGDANLQYIVADKGVKISRGRRMLGHSSYPMFIAKGSTV